MLTAFCLSPLPTFKVDKTVTVAVVMDERSKTATKKHSAIKKEVKRRSGSLSPKKAPAGDDVGPSQDKEVRSRK